MMLFFLESVKWEIFNYGTIVQVWEVLPFDFIGKQVPLHFYNQQTWDGGYIQIDEYGFTYVQFMQVESVETIAICFIPLEMAVQWEFLIFLMIKLWILYMDI